MQTRDAILLQEQSSPSTPAAGFVAFFAKTDHTLWWKDSNGLEWPVSSVTDKITATIAGLTTTSPAYSINDTMGTEMTFAGATLAAGRQSILHDAVVVDASKVIGAIDLYLFDSASTPAGDNAAEAWSDANILKLLGVLSFETPKAGANNSWARAIAGPPIILKPASGTSVFGVAVTRTANAVFTGATDLQFRLGIEQF